MGKFIFCLWVVTLSGFSAFASGAEGRNGGGGWKCGKKIESYDLYEGRALLEGLAIPEWDGKLSEEQILTEALNKIENEFPHFGREVKKWAKFYIISRDKFSASRGKNKRHIKLTLVPDADILLSEDGCSYVQLVNWMDHFTYDKKSGAPIQNIIFDLKSLNFEDNLNKAATTVHEAVYKTLRRNMDFYGRSTEDSKEVRHFVARVFSQGKIGEPLVDELDSSLLLGLF